MDTARRGRPRRNARSTYASTADEEVEHEQPMQDQPPPMEE